MSDINEQLAAKVEQTIARLKEAVAAHEKISLANSLGAEDMVITDLLAKAGVNASMFVLDTGRLPEETLELLQKTKEHYPNLAIQVYYPESADVEAYVADNGINAFYESQALRKGCCEVRKLRPLRRALGTLDAWITGLRREQSVTRDTIEFSEWDEGNNLQKYNPLADWSEKEVWAYIKANAVPYNALHDRHYPSIGCAPCTRSITVGEDVRAGRWWWENPELRECGLHPGSKVEVTPINFLK